VTLNSISYYMNLDQMHRNLFVVAPEGELSVNVGFEADDPRIEEQALAGSRAMLEGLPAGWEYEEEAKRAADRACGFTIQPDGAAEGDIYAFDVIIRDRDNSRRIPAQVLVAGAPLVSEAEQADRVTGDVTPVILPEASGAKEMRFDGNGKLSFDFITNHEKKYALWLHARWDEDSNTAMILTLDGKPRDLSPRASYGGGPWTDPKYAHTKKPIRYNEQYVLWKWYRIPEVQLSAGKHQLDLSAEGGAHFDALMLLPQTQVMDRAAMNLFQNWNYAPWRNPQ
jgi:hypothetical protein